MTKKYIINPSTGRKVKIDGKVGKKVIANYKKNIKRGSGRYIEKISDTPANHNFETFYKHQSFRLASENEKLKEENSKLKNLVKNYKLEINRLEKIEEECKKIKKKYKQNNIQNILNMYHQNMNAPKRPNLLPVRSSGERRISAFENL